MTTLALVLYTHDEYDTSLVPSADSVSSGGTEDLVRQLNRKKGTVDGRTTGPSSIVSSGSSSRNSVNCDLDDSDDSDATDESSEVEIVEPPSDYGKNSADDGSVLSEGQENMDEESEPGVYVDEPAMKEDDDDVGDNDYENMSRLTLSLHVASPALNSASNGLKSALQGQVGSSS